MMVEISKEYGTKGISKAKVKCNGRQDRNIQGISIITKDKAKELTTSPMDDNGQVNGKMTVKMDLVVINLKVS